MHASQPDRQFMSVRQSINAVKYCLLTIKQQIVSEDLLPPNLAQTRNVNKPIKVDSVAKSERIHGDINGDLLHEPYQNQLHELVTQIIG